MGNDGPLSASKRVLKKELEKLQRKLNGLKKTAKHIEAKQNWINRESKRLESESAKLAEGQESLRVRKETLRVAYEEIKILREDSLREGDSVYKNKSHMVSPESTEEIRNVEQQELAFWRGPASKTLAGWTQDGSAEEIAGWMFEAQGLNREVEAKKRKFPRGDREGIQERCQNGRRLHGWCGWLSVVVRVQTQRLQAISEWKRPGEGKEFGSVECWDGTGVFESVELERGWTGLGGLFGHFPVADFDAHRLGRFVVGRMSQKIGWSARWCIRIVHVRTLGRIAMPRSHRESEMERTIKRSELYGLARGRWQVGAAAHARKGGLRFSCRRRLLVWATTSLF